MYVSHRPPDCPVACFETFLEPNYMQALLHAKPVFVLGHLNCNSLKSSPEQKALIGISAERNLTQIIKDPPATHTLTLFSPRSRNLYVKAVC